MKTKLTKNVSFLKPFLEGIGSLVPLGNVSVIRGYRVAKRLNERSYASIIRHSKKNYSVNIQTQFLVDNGKNYSYSTLERILLSLAHELAHLKDWENPDWHSATHFKLQSKIMLHFAEKLRKTGIKDHNVTIDRIRRSNED